MARAWLMTLVFVVALLFFLIVTMPARVVIKEQSYSVGNDQIRLSNVSGRVLKGTARWQWRELSGALQWSVQRRFLKPTVKVVVRSAPLEAEGRVAFSFSGGVIAENIKLSADVEAFSEALSLSVGGAEGAILGELQQVSLAPKGGVSAEGVINYSGGRIHWTNGSATVGPLQLTANSETPQSTRLALHAPSSSQLYMDGSFEGRVFEWQVYRRWVQLLGMSQGGSADDVVFRISDQW